MKKIYKKTIMAITTIFLLSCIADAGVTLRPINETDPMPILETFHGTWGVVADPVPFGLVDGYVVRQMLISITPDGQETIIGDILLILDGVFEEETISFSLILDVDSVSLSGTAVYQEISYSISGTYSLSDGFFVSFWNVDGMEDLVFYLFGVID